MIHLESGIGKASAVTGRNLTPRSYSGIKAKYTMLWNEMAAVTGIA